MTDSIKAPGLVWRVRRTGRAAVWQARRDLVARGWKPASQVLCFLDGEPTERDTAWIVDTCNRLQSEMLVWGRGGIPVMSAFDGKLRSLINAYQLDADSPYRKIRFASRRNYDWQMRTLAKEVGDELLADINARLLRRWHEGWLEGRGVTTAHGLIGMLRLLCNFGATLLEDTECERLCGLLHRMKFQMAKPRQERLTAEQAAAIRAKAHEMGKPSIALAQALQFEGTFRQKDIIGEWVPIGEPGLSEVEDGTGQKWVRGLRWSEIDQNLVLRHTTSKRNKDVEVALKYGPMVMEELARLGELPKSGPVIVSEVTGLPYRAHHFRKSWRRVARAAGIPDEVFSMDTRAGAISEATDAGASLELVRHAATHSNVSTTANYSRGSTDKIAEVMQMRGKHRNKPRTE
jgi:hypothetical protein